MNLFIPWIDDVIIRLPMDGKYLSTPTTTIAATVSPRTASSDTSRGGRPRNKRAAGYSQVGVVERPPTRESGEN